MRTKHTPGPWRYAGDPVKNDLGFYQVVIKRYPFNQLPTEEDKTVIGCVFGRTKEKAKANADVIAAADDLLNALFAVLEGFKMCVPPHKWETNDRILKAEAAIAKATGGTK